MLLASGLLLGWTAIVTVVSAVAIVRALRRSAPLHGAARSPSPSPSPSPPLPRVVVVRPCAGLEPQLRRSLASTASLRYRGPLRIVLSTSTSEDPARPVLLEVANSLRARGLDVAVQVVPPRGVNLKASQLSGVLDESDDEIALIVDSDVELEGLDLEGMVAALHGPNRRVAAVWCPPVEREPFSLGDYMSAAVLGGSLHAFSLLGALDPRGLVGKTFAVRLAAVRNVGGFGGLVQHLGEDMELARRLRERGWSTVMGNTTISSLASRRSVGQVLGRYARWLLVIRAQRPALLASYPLLLAATPGLLLCGALGLRAGAAGSGLAMIVVGITRVTVAFVAAKLARRRATLGRSLLDAVLSDLLLMAALLRALGPTRVRWRDRALRIGPGGVLEPS